MPTPLRSVANNWKHPLNTKRCAEATNGLILVPIGAPAHSAAESGKLIANHYGMVTNEFFPVTPYIGRVIIFFMKTNKIQT